MAQMVLLEQLQSYEAIDATETAHLKRTIAFLQQTPRPFHRETLAGHLSASAIVVNSTYSHILLLHHRKLNGWLQPGGHCDGDSNMLAVARREVQEETGLTATPVDAAIFDVDVHCIPATETVLEHWHYDIRYLLLADDQAPLKRSQREAKALQWVSLTQLGQFTADASLHRMARKLHAKECDAIRFATQSELRAINRDDNRGEADHDPV